VPQAKINQVKRMIPSLFILSSIDCKVHKSGKARTA
jgi:hypothetical protein